MYNGFEEDAMTYTQPNIDTDFSIIPGEDIAVMAKKMQAAGQCQGNRPRGNEETRNSYWLN
jgi:hypothetical protein